MTNVVMLAYDIILNENNDLEVETYNVNLERDKDNNSFYTFEVMGRTAVSPQDLPKVIEDLRKKDYFSLTRLKPTAFGFEEGSIPYLMRSVILPIRNKLLEKVYYETIIDGICHIVLYVTYVNVNTGEIFALKANDLGIYSEELEAKVESREFKHINSSFLGTYANKMDSAKQKPLALTRKK